MTLNQAKTKVAQKLLLLNVGHDMIHLIIDMTRDECIVTAANFIETHNDISLNDMKALVYFPECSTQPV